MDPPVSYLATQFNACDATAGSAGGCAASGSGHLRGMLRPLLVGDTMRLVFEEPEEARSASTDEAKVSQILRNLVSNAVKFTETGQHHGRGRARSLDAVLVPRCATRASASRAEHQERIFEEFAQVESPLQTKVKGTGLGLALCAEARRGPRRHAHRATARRAGAPTFTVTVPRVYPEVVERLEPHRARQRRPARAPPVLVLEDDRQTLFLYEKYLARSGFQVLPVRTVDEARAAMSGSARRRGAGRACSWGARPAGASSPRPNPIPASATCRSSSRPRSRTRRRGSPSARTRRTGVKPVARAWLLRELRHRVLRPAARRRVLVIDNDEIVRYLVRQRLAHFEIAEAATGEDGLEQARLAPRRTSSSWTS